VRGLANHGLALLFVLVLAQALYWLWTGVEGAVAYHRRDGETWWQVFRRRIWWRSWRVMSNTRIGLSMLEAMGGGVLFILFGAGLKS
jgi:hypothetical protein